MRVVKIGAVWCNGCLVMNNVWNKVLKNKDIDTKALDIDMDEEEVKDYNIGDTLPVFIFYSGDKEVKRVVSDKFIIEHHPDRTKSRSNYLALLELEYQENRTDPMCMIYYGCELSFHNRDKEAHEVSTLSARTHRRLQQLQLSETFHSPY